MTNHEIAIATARTLESDPAYMSLAMRYENNPNSLTDAELSKMIDMAESVMPSFDEWAIMTELGFFDDD